MTVLSLDKFLPTWSIIYNYTGWMVIYIALVAVLVSKLKGSKSVKTAYTRKIFHFFIFTAAAIMQFILGLKATVLFSVLVIGLILWIVWRGPQNPLYKALARDADKPHAGKFIIIPLFATALGGILSNLFFPAFAFIGYLVGGWGDAIGEPVGAKWGKHKYKVKTLFGVKATRSLEGSFAIFVVSAIICLFAYLFLSYQFHSAIKYALICALLATLTEAFSSHGLDNLTIQVVVAAVSYYLLT